MEVFSLSLIYLFIIYHYYTHWIISILIDRNCVSSVHEAYEILPIKFNCMVRDFLAQLGRKTRCAKYLYLVNFELLLRQRGR